jgi:multidrug efflux system membrane fusion protein|tara:strand:- start:3059 stop:4198 length:1140 start_codon:yes stop_codon:yes gene_type:complete
MVALNKNVRVSLILAVAIFLWLASGLLLSPATDGNADKAAVDADLTSIEATWQQVQQFRPQLSLRAKTEANRVVDVKAQIGGRIIAVPVKEGAKVVAGDTLCKIDAEDRAQRIEHATAALAQAKIEFNGALKLKQSGYQSELAIAQAKTKLEAARVTFERSGLDLQNLSIKAPFDGIVESRPVEIGDFVQPGQLCAQIVELNPLKISAVITESEISKVSLGSDARVTLVNGDNLNGKMTYLSHQADAVTRSYRVEAKVENPQLKFLAGMSGRLQIDSQPIAAHLISASLMLLDDQGRLAVRAVSEQGVISTLSINTVGENSDGVWVAGLPDQVALVTLGQNYVAEGEQVTVSFSNSPEPLNSPELLNNPELLSISPDSL